MNSFYNSSVIYVAETSGDDKNNGLSQVADSKGNGPFKTIERALAVVRELRAVGDNRPLTIALTEDYYMTSPISITEESGITFESHGERHRIIGGMKLEGWIKDNFNGADCFSLTLPEKENGEEWEVTDMFVNGKRAKTTRYPKTGTLKAIEVEKNVPTDGFYTHSKWFIADMNDLEVIDGIENAMVNYYHYWVDEHSPIESFDRETGKVIMKYLSRFYMNTQYGDAETGEGASAAAIRYYLTNIPQMFDGANQWYWDKANRKIYYIPENENILPDEIEAYIPITSDFFRISADNIRIRNLEFMYTKGDYASKMQNISSVVTDGEETMFASDAQSVSHAPGSISFDYAKNCGIYNCYLHGVGIYGITVGRGCNDIRIEENVIEDICAGGIKIFGGEYGCEDKELTSHCYILRNKIAHGGKRYAAGCGIIVNHSFNNEISENEVHDFEYTGISVGWVWGYKPSNTYGNIIRRNHVYNIGKGNLSDMGGIYLLGKQCSTVVSENVIHDVTCANYGAWGIYTDEGSSCMTIEKNIVYRTKSECFNQHYGSQNVVRHNIFAFGGSGIVKFTRNEMHQGALLENNIFVTDGQPIYANETSITPLECKNNIIWDISGKEPILYIDKTGKEHNLESWVREYSKDSGSIVKDPLFADAALFDFVLCEGSPAFGMGFSRD